MLRIVTILFAMLATSSGLAQQDSFDTFVCEFKGQNVSFVVEADLKADGTFFEEVTYTSNGAPHFYSLSQKQVHGNEKYRFVINEEKPSAAVRVVVSKTPGKALSATATLLGVKSRPQDVPGHCAVE